MNSDKYAIRVENVTKKFRVHMERNMTLKERVLYAGRAKHKDFVALDNVSITVARGSTLGLIGTNGSGKSTLLKLIARILHPDSGSISVVGNVSSLLELGAGFHPEFTGRENIFMNGALLGLSKKEIQYKLDEIIEFSELGDFIEEPVRSYSSGMYMRLAFSVAVAVDPEILLVDEILAVGDAAFQTKCMSRIKQLQAQNKTIVIVTHDAGAVETYCNEAVWLHNSRVQMQGDTISCVHAYLDTVFRNAHEGISTMSFDRNKENETQESESNGAEDSTESISLEVMNESQWGTREAVIESVVVRSETGTGIVRCGEDLDVDMEYSADQPISEAVFGVAFFQENGVHCYGTNTKIDRLGPVTIDIGSGHVSFNVKGFMLMPGSYLLNVAIGTLGGKELFYWRGAAKITVISDIGDKGISRLSHEWVINGKVVSSPRLITSKV